MWWVGPQGPRYKIQKFISIIVLVIAISFLFGQIEAFLSGEAPFIDVLGGILITAFGAGMFYMSDKW